MGLTRTLALGHKGLPCLRAGPKSWSMRLFYEPTTVGIDLEQPSIVHRCPVWSRLVSEKKFCHHVARAFLMVIPERARSLLSLIQSSLDDWRFESKLAVEFPA